MTTTAIETSAKARDGKPFESRMGIKAVIEPGVSAMCTLTPDLLKKISFISTYDNEDPQSPSPKKHGYQRNPMPERFPGIAKYYLAGQNRFLIPPIIASIRVYDLEKQERFNQLFNAGDIAGIHAEFERSAFSIVDGQHRLNGLYTAWAEDPHFNADVPVMMFYGLTYAEEAALFDDINTNQRKLPKALIEVTQVYTKEGEGGHAQAVREISFSVATDGDSVWGDKVNMTGARDPDRSVTYEGLRRATSQMFPERILDRLRARGFSAKDVAKKYWQLVASACDTAWSEKPRLVRNPETGELEEQKVHYRLKDLVGVASLAKLGQDIINTSLDKSGNEPDFYHAMADLTTRLQDVDWEKGKHNPWMASQAGFAGQKDLYEILYKLVYLSEQPGEAVHHGE